MMEAFRVLLAQSIDYAGLFPPASLAMPAAAACYATERQGSHAWMLGRFVVPAARLEEFMAARREAGRGDARAWRLSVLLGTEIDAELMLAFNRRYAASSSGDAAVIEALEFQAATPAAIAGAARHLPAIQEAFCEFGPERDLAACLAAVKAARLCAKVRTGGVNAAQFPTPAALAGWIAAAAAAGVPFKATAGLHHAVRGTHSLTYEPVSGRAMMHGFLNVLLAAAFARQGWAAPELETLLAEDTPDAFTFDASGAAWRGRQIATADLAQARASFCHSFGSCSVAEPVAELRALRLL